MRLAFVLALALLTGCTQLSQMSDDWCDAHPHAGQNRCWGQQ